MTRHHALAIVLALAALPVGAATPAAVTPDVPTGAAAARDAELAKLAAPIVDAFTNTAPSFTPDGRKVVFLSARDGMPQPYVADAARPDAPAARLATLKQRVGAVRPTPDGKYVLFTSDVGADENWSIYRVTIDGKDLSELTPGETLNRDAPIVARGAPGMLYYSARKVSAPASTLYALPVAGGTPKRIFGSPQPGALEDVDAAGKRALWRRFPSRTENYVDVVDLATGQAKVAYPTAGLPVAIMAAHFSSDGTRVLVSTDGGGERALIVAVDVRSGKELARYVEAKRPTGSINDLEVSPKGDRVAVKVNAGDHDEVRLLDARKLDVVADVALPLGSGTLGRFSEDGRRVTLTWSTPAAPTDIHAIDVKSAKAAPLRAEARPSAELAPVDVKIDEVKAFDGQSIPVLVYLPAGLPAGKKLPTIVNYHGGPAGVSAVRWFPVARFFLSLGYAWVEPNVRGSSGFGRAYEMGDNGPKRLDAFKDIEATGRWAAAQPWADKDRLVIFGGSYGGYTVLVGMTRMPDLWRAGVDLFGVVNLRTFLQTTSGLIREVFKVEFGDLDKDGAFLDSISPITDVAKIARPLYVYAGANDPRVPRPESDQIVAAVRARGLPVEYQVADDEGHSLARRATLLTFLSRSARFLETHLAKPAKTQ